MGLDLLVGCLADVEEAYRDDELLRLKTLSECLVRAGLKPHVEPAALTGDDVFSCQMWGYSGLHHLRKLAAFVALEQALYEPSDDIGENDHPVVEDYYNRVGNGDISDLPFQHLMLHGDSEGYYVPQDFAQVVDPGEDDFELTGGAIGSTHRLLAECRQLAAVLELPPALDPESSIVLDAAESPGEGPAKWQRYGVESFSCLSLMRACEHSIRTGGVLVFC